MSNTALRLAVAREGHNASQIDFRRFDRDHTSPSAAAAPTHRRPIGAWYAPCCTCYCAPLLRVSTRRSLRSVARCRECVLLFARAALSENLPSWRASRVLSCSAAAVRVWRASCAFVTTPSARCTAFADVSARLASSCNVVRRRPRCARRITTRAVAQCTGGAQLCCVSDADKRHSVGVERKSAFFVRAFEL